MKSGKWHQTDGMELLHQEKIRTLAEKETYRYVGILEADIIKKVEIEKIKKEYLKLKSFSTRNYHAETLSKEQIPGLYTSLYIRSLSQMDQRRTLVNGPKNKKTNDYAWGIKSQKKRWQTLHIKKGERKRTCQHWRRCWRTDTTTRGLYTKTWRIDYIRNETENTMDNRITITRKQKWEVKQLYGCFKWLRNNISHDKTWTWLRKGNSKREIESLLIAAQNVIITNHIKARIDKTQQNSKCRLCGDKTKRSIT